MINKLLLLLIAFPAFCQNVNINNIEIIRDNYGVPHIYSDTDKELAYGLAWAHSEDDFKTIQEAYLAGNALLSKHLGLRGAPVDFLTQLIQSEEVIDSLYETIDKNFLEVAEGYAQGINRYAELNPDKVLVKKLFPITPKKMLKYSFLQLFISSEGDRAIRAIFENDFESLNFQRRNELGSNLFSFSTKKTNNGETYMAVNTHQPLEGPTSWYEAHLESKEGTSIIGATFAGAPCILTGSNKNLAWTHTVNRPDKTDIFQLEMVKKSKRKYYFDNKVLKLKKYRGKAFINILGIPIRVSKKYYSSVYGPTLKNKTGFFSVRTGSLFKVRALEQWWKMNKATSFDEFYSILEMNEIPGYNIGYADKDDNIFYISNGLIPIRNDKFKWTGVLPGNTSETLWTDYYKTHELPQVINPKSGYIYNANHSPFLSTSIDENPNPQDFAANMGFETFNNNRSTRIFELVESHKSIDYEIFKKIKYDNKFPTPFNYNFMDVNNIMEMQPDNYPEVANLIKQIQNWDRSTDASSTGAGAFAMFYYTLADKYFYKSYHDKNFSKSLIADCLVEVKKRMKKYFDSTTIKLGDFQKLVRGDKEIPIFGMPDVITAMNASKYKDGKVQVTHGESYIQLVKFSSKGTEIESIISYGSSDNKESPHYNDQMEKYSKFQTKKMSFERDWVLKNSKRVYNPK